jgi:diguanylate cyclase (GGDEF)-like protein/PAS domain S-box-containing protein
MLNILACIVYEHDLWLVALSAIICALGCITTTTLLARAHESTSTHRTRWLVLAAIIFGCSVWSLHFVAMLAFIPGHEMAYDLQLTGLSIIVASSGAMAAFLVWHASFPKLMQIVLGGLLLGISIAGMHYIGVAAMTFSGFLMFDSNYVMASVITSIVFATVASAKATPMKRLARRLEVGIWLAITICGLHFIGMTAITVVPGVADANSGTVLGTATLAFVVGSVSVAILLASLAATMVEQFMSQRVLQDLSRMRLLSNLAQEILFIHSDGVVREVNSAGERLFKASAKDIIGRPVLSMFTEDSAPALIRRDLCPPWGREPEETNFQSIDGSQVSVELSCQPIDYLGKPATAVALRDLTARKRDEARIRHLARHDALTNLPNRYTLLERFDFALDHAAQSGSAIAIAYIDLDRFKGVNDLYGHAVGDALLVQVSKRITAEIQVADTLARIGGDEFVMMLTTDPQPEKVSITAMRIIESLRRPFQIEGHRVEIGASVGIALYPNDGATSDTLLRAADTAMYRVKQEGRGALRFYKTSMNVQLQARLRLEQELAGAIEREELVLHYQPLVNGITGKVETFEALVRWQHPRLGMVPPTEFIPLAEESGLIDQIGQWVIETACREAAGWEQPWRVSVNVSPSQFRHSDICGIVATALQVNQVDATRIVVEVTEGVLIDDAAKAVATLTRLRELGIRIALDDFGTGYASLSYLRLFKFDKLKIDRSFITELGQSDDALTITRTIVNLGHNLGLQVTAEGVENQAQLAILQMLGCDQIQGYLVARPAPMEVFTTLDCDRMIALFTKNFPLRAAEDCLQAS